MKRKVIFLTILVTIILSFTFLFPSAAFAGFYPSATVFFSITSSPFDEEITIQTSYSSYDEALAAAKQMAMDSMYRQEIQKEIAGLSDEQFVEYLYDALFNRASDEEGLNSWLNGLSNGLSRDAVIKAFIDSDEFALRYVGKFISQRAPF